MRKITALIYLVFALPAFAQTGNASITAFADVVAQFNARMPQEKLYIHMDKPACSNTDTLWLKAYLLDNGLQPSFQSGVLYVEMVNDTGKVVLRQAMPVFFGISWGQLVLDSITVAEGNYTLRAYTNWMQNIGEAGFFKRQFYISKADDDVWLVNTENKTTIQADKVNVQESLSFSSPDGNPLRFKDMQIKLTDGKRTWQPQKSQTDINGKLDVNYNISNKAGTNKLTLIAEAGKDSNKKLVIPIQLPGVVYTDVQFMPEGGHLVAGLSTKIGFKAVSSNERGVHVSGIVLDSKNQEAATFKSSYKGMGYFMFTPAAGETYTAIVNTNTNTKTYNFPNVQPSGVALTIGNIPGRDSIIMSVQATTDISMGALKGYSIIAQSGGNVCYTSFLNFNGKHTINGRVPKSKFPAGLARFTLFDGSNKPVAERLIYINHHNGLNIELIPQQQHYRVNDSIAIDIKVTDNNNKPVQGSFSLAVTDDSTIKTDSSNIADITGYMLLQSDLKGYIEEPGYYFTNVTAQTETHLDNMLLTQGWVGYSWRNVLDSTTTPQYLAQKEIEVTGIVKRLSKPQAGLKVNLLSAKPLLLRDTLTDSCGRFRFAGLGRIDTASFIIQTKDKKGKIFEATVIVDEFSPANTKYVPTPNVTPWYVNSNSTALNYNSTSIAMQKEQDRLQFSDGIKLQEVVIRGNKVIKGSKNLNGPGNADQVIDEQEMIKKGNTSLLDLLSNGLIKGFGKGWFPTRLMSENVRNRLDPYTNLHHAYKLHDKKLRFVIDGVDIHDFFQIISGNNNHYEEIYYNTSFLAQLKAGDIKGIEVLYANKFNRKYSTANLQPAQLLHTGNPADAFNIEYAYIEITTWSGSGAFMKHVQGRYLYRPMPLSWPQTFYQPKYPVSNNVLYNLRPTLYWNPNIITDKTGRARVVLYSKNKRGSYTAILQGADLNGHVGSKQLKIKIE